MDRPEPETIVEIVAELWKNSFWKFVEIQIEILIAFQRLHRLMCVKNVSKTLQVLNEECANTLSLEEREKIAKEKVSNTKGPEKSLSAEPSQKILPPKPLMRPQTGYTVFCSKTRPEVKLEHPNLSAKKINKKLSLLWKNLDPSDKHAFNETAESNKASNDMDMENMEIYNRAIAKIKQEEVFTQEVNTSEDNLKTRRSLRKIGSIPQKPPITSYQVYLGLEESDIKIQNSNMSAKEIGKKLKIQWKHLDYYQIQLCRTIARANREQYLREVDGYKNSLDNTDLLLTKQKQKANELRNIYCEYKKESTLRKINSNTHPAREVASIVIMLVISFAITNYLFFLHKRRKLPQISDLDEFLLSLQYE